MSMMVFLFIFMTSLTVTSSFPMTIILGIILCTIFGSSEMLMNNNIPWMSMIVIMLFVGGLMVVYIFILSMNSNEMINLKMSMSFMIPIIIIFMMNMSNQKEEKNMLGSMIFSNSWNILILIMMSIIISMIFMSKMIFNPSNPSKSMK